MILSLLAAASCLLAIAAPAPPVITTPVVPGAPSSGAARRSDLHQQAALDAFRPRNPEPDIAVRDVKFDHVRSVFKNVHDSVKVALPVNGVTIERVEATCTFKCFHFGMTGSAIAVRDAVLKGAGPKAYSNGAQIEGQAHDVLFERVIASGFTSTEPAGYTNADGFVTERGTFNITFRHAQALDNTDGGFDLKSTNTLLDYTYAARNRRNYRLWGSGRGTTLVSDSPRDAHVWLAGTADYVIDRLVAKGPGVLVKGEAGAKLEIRSCDLTGWTGTKKVAGGGAAVVLGVGC